jgi:hypothetical protein
MFDGDRHFALVGRDDRHEPVGEGLGEDWTGKNQNRRDRDEPHIGRHSELRKLTTQY